MKKRLRKTGEIVDVIAWYNMLGAERDRGDSVSYIDSKGNECVKVEGLNLLWDFEDVEEVQSTNIDWEQRRYEIAKEVLPEQILFWQKCNELDADDNNDEPWGNSYETAAKFSIIVADTLIAELLRKGGDK